MVYEFINTELKNKQFYKLNLKIIYDLCKKFLSIYIFLKNKIINKIKILRFKN
jgi:hypothetical protein